MRRILAIIALAIGCCQSVGAESGSQRRQIVFATFTGAVLSDSPGHLVVEGQLFGDLAGEMSIIAQPVPVEQRTGATRRFIGNSQIVARDGFFLTSDSAHTFRTGQRNRELWIAEHHILIGTGAFRDRSGVIHCVGVIDWTTGEVEMRVIGLITPGDGSGE
ncbi:MAG: hypothetical protein ACYTJ0_04050 [Planctomycetota bacterium]|jgi:hypothetical protein